MSTLQYKNIKFQVWDLGGQSSIRSVVRKVHLCGNLTLRLSPRPYWRCYFPNTSAIIYVIDASDTDRLDTSRSELLTMLSEEELAGVPLLVFCNKQDMQGALPSETISEKLGLAGGEKERQWSVRGSCATKGEGLEEGLDWYVTFIATTLYEDVWLTRMPGLSMQYRKNSSHPLTGTWFLPFVCTHWFCWVLLLGRDVP